MRNCLDSTLYYIGILFFSTTLVLSLICIHYRVKIDFILIFLIGSLIGILVYVLKLQKDESVVWKKRFTLLQFVTQVYLIFVSLDILFLNSFSILVNLSIAVFLCMLPYYMVRTFREIRGLRRIND